MKRRLAAIDFTRERAEEHAHHWRSMGRRPRIYQRSMRAESISIFVWVVVVDEPEHAAHPAPELGEGADRG